MSAAAPCAGGLTTVRATLRDAYDAAADGRQIEHRLHLAGETILLRFAGPAMVSNVLPALSHLLAPADASPPSLRIRIWDTASSQSRLPDLPEAVLRPGRVVAHPISADGILVAMNTWERRLSLLDETTGEALHCVADAASVAPYEVAHPLTTILGWWARRSGRYLVHSAAVGTDAGALLLAGASGAGKSTSALACLRAGLRFIGDDTVLLGDDPPEVRSLYCSGRADVALVEQRSDAFPELPLPSGEGKVAAFFGPERMTASLPLRAIVLPRVRPGARSGLLPASRSAALLTLAPEPVLYQRHGGGGSLALIGGLVRRLPVHALTVGDDLERVPELLANLLDGVLACA